MTHANKTALRHLLAVLASIETDADTDEASRDPEFNMGLHRASGYIVGEIANIIGHSNPTHYESVKRDARLALEL